ncbi:MAG: hypothetical protein AAF960_01010, partial [Bacteroidota bacterium]
MTNPNFVRLKQYLPTVLSAFLCVLLLTNCGEEDVIPPTFRATSIEFTCNRDKSESFRVDETIVFTIKLITDSSVGIGQFTILKSGQELFSKSDYTANEVNFQFTYDTTKEDLEAGVADFTFELTDKNGTVERERSMVTVAVDFPITIAQIRPNAGWSFETDMAVDGMDAAATDILQTDSVAITVFTLWSSPNRGQFYLLPEEKAVDFFDINLTSESVETAIQGVESVGKIDVTSGGPFVNGQVIFKSSSSENLIIIDHSNLQAS